MEVKLDRAIILQSLAPVTPSDTDFVRPGYVVVLGNAGNVSVETVNGETVTLPLDQKEIFPLQVRRIRATGTTATSIHIGR